MNELTGQYESLRSGVGFSVLAGRTQIEITGEDRSKLLHSFCTNDIEKLAPGDGCEAFITNVQGKTVGFVFVLCSDQSLYLETAPGHGQAIIGHLNRYVIREDVEFHDRTPTFGTILLAGLKSTELLQKLSASTVPTQLYGHVSRQISDVDVAVRCVPTAGQPSYSIVFYANSLDQLTATFSGEATACSSEAIEICRIENGVPEFGIDITDANLPQEVDRDAAAISFSKGCYLGQETVARLDALGHVNRKLVAMRFAGEQVPERGTELSVGEKVIGHITSAAVSPRYDGVLALGYVRREHFAAGTTLSSPVGDAEVVNLRQGDP